MFVFVDFQHDAANLLTFLQAFAGVIVFLGPAQVGDVNQAVDARFDFDKRAVIGQAGDLGGDHGADRVFLSGDGPRVGFKLLDAQRDFLFFLVDIQDDHFDFAGRPA